MKYRKLGNTGIEVSEIAFGAEFLVERPYEDTEVLIRACEENGIKSLFDGKEFKTGIFVYNEYEDEWDDWEEYFKRMTDKNEQIIKLLNW